MNKRLQQDADLLQASYIPFSLQRLLVCSILASDVSNASTCSNSALFLL